VRSTDAELAGVASRSWCVTNELAVFGTRL
jgi:hypothetical protein